MTDATHDFLVRANWETADQSPLAGDASSRSYTRLTRPDTGQTAMLMRDPGDSIPVFQRLARHLCDLNLSAPQIIASDPSHGLLLIEDLGDDVFARLCDYDPSMETPLYIAATDALIELHKHPLPNGLVHATPSHLAQMIDPAFEHYQAHVGTPVDPSIQNTIIQAFSAVLETYSNNTSVMVLRDYHAENLIWLPDRNGPARAGLLDFQDALAGPPVYDLVSLLQDARRDVSDQTLTATIQHYLRITGDDPVQFNAAYACLGAQRNLRIIGVFARLCHTMGKAHYVDLIPRVWAHLQTDLAHPALAEVAEHLNAHLTPPDPEILGKLKSQCPQKSLTP